VKIKYLFRVDWIMIKHYSPIVEDVAKIILSNSDWDISYEGVYTIILENSNYKIKFWNSNKYFAWMTDGSIINKSKGTQYNWGDGRPKRFTMLKVDDLISDITRKKFFQEIKPELTQERTEHTERTEHHSRTHRFLRPEKKRKRFWESIWMRLQ